MKFKKDDKENESGWKRITHAYIYKQLNLAYHMKAVNSLLIDRIKVLLSEADLWNSEKHNLVFGCTLVPA